MFRKIKRIIEWLPILWKDEDWAFDPFIITFLKEKLKRLEKTLREANRHLNVEKDCRRIREVLHHFERYQNWQRYYPSDFPTMKPIGKSSKGFTRVDYESDADRKKARRMMDFITQMETWHWDEAWRKIAHYSRGWWD